MPRNPDKKDSDVYSLLHAQAQAHPKKTAIESPRRHSLTYAGLHRLVQNVMMMFTEAGIRSQDRVAIVLPNGPEMSIMLLSVSCIAVSIPLNPEYKQEELEKYFSDLNIKFLITENNREGAPFLAGINNNVRVLEIPLGSARDSDKMSNKLSPMFGTAKFREFYVPPEEREFNEERFFEVMEKLPSPQDIAVILHTAGTTSRSKVVALTHGQIMESARRIGESLRLDTVDRCLCMLPQFHVGGLVDMLLAPLISGGSVVCTAGFDANRFFTCLREFQPTWYQGVPTTLHELLNYSHDRDVGEISPPLRFIRSVSSPLPATLMSELESTFGVPIIEIYGMTEASPLIASNPLPPEERKAGTVGLPHGPAVRIVDEAGKELELGETGEVEIRGETVISRYEGNEEANKASFRDGWFRTGDLGYFDKEGYLYLRGRLKEMINRGGEKISPFEVDSVLLSHEGVAQSVSFPIPHRSLGESVAALVVLKPGVELDEAALQSYAAERLAGFKVPQRILFTKMLPKGATGKVKRLGLAEELNLDFSSEYIAPRTSLEKRLAEIWSDVLGLPEVGIRDDFFDLGGNSLSGTVLFERIDRQLEGLSMEAGLTRLSTIEQMAETIQQVSILTPSDVPSEVTAGKEKGLPDYAELALRRATAAARIPSLESDSVFMGINTDGKKLPLFWCFNRPEYEILPFAEGLGPDRPLYGFLSGSKLFECTKDLVRRTGDFYLDELLKLDLPEPLILAGHCRGAAVIFDMALRLRKMGKTNLHLLFMEYFDPQMYEYPDDFTLIYGRWSLVRGYKAFSFGHIGWRERFVNPPEVILIDGNHGEYWEAPYLEGFAQTVNIFLEKAN